MSTTPEGNTAMSTLTEKDLWSCSSEQDVDKVLRGIGNPFAITVAQLLAYFEAQDGLLSQAQEKAERLRLELAETKRPLSEQMARLNKSVIDANSRASAAEMKLARAEQAKPAMSGTLSDRQLFEAWARSVAMSLQHDNDFPKTYASSVTDAAWGAWQARAALAEQAGQVVEQDDLTTLRHARIFLTTREKMHPAGLAQWDEMVARLAASPPEQGSAA